MVSAAWVGEPVVEVELRGVGEGGVEFDADDLVEGEFAGDEHGAAFAGADVEEGVVRDGMGWGGGAPEVDEGAEDAGGDAVVGGDVGVVGVAGDEVAGGDEAAGLDAVDLVEGVLGRRGVGMTIGALGLRVGMGFSGSGSGCGLPSRPRVLRPVGVMLRGDQVGSSRRVMVVWLTVSRPARRLAIWAWSWAVGGFVGLGGGEFDLDFVFLGDAGDVVRRGLRGRG